MLSKYSKIIYMLLKDFFRLRLISHYIIINDSGIFYFTIDGKKVDVLVTVSTSEAENLKERLDIFTGRLKNKDSYLGQPVTILVGGSFSFHHIESVRPGSRLEPDRIFGWLDKETSILKIKYLQDKKRGKILFCSGIKKHDHETVWNTLQNAGILIQQFIPVSLFVLEHGLQKPDSIPMAIRLPGETAWLFADDKISVVVKNSAIDGEDDFCKRDIEEKLNPTKKRVGYFSYSDKKAPGDHTKTFPLNTIFRRIDFRLKSQKIFFSVRLQTIWTRAIKI